MNNILAIVLFLTIASLSLTACQNYSSTPNASNNNTNANQAPSDNTSNVNANSNTNQNQIAANAISIDISNFSFSPSAASASVGATVTWTNNDSVPHQIVADSGGFQSPILRQGEQFSYTFSQSGEFSYHCSIHPSMKASIIIN